MGAFSKAQAGDADALSALLRRHIPLVQALARRFSYSEDAFQQGCMGLLYAIRHFREDSGCQFSTYAVSWAGAPVPGSTTRNDTRNVFFPLPAKSPAFMSWRHTREFVPRN